MTSLLLTIAGHQLRISGEGLEVEIVDRDDDSELNGIADYGARLDAKFQEFPPAPEHKAAGHARRKMGSDGANTEQVDVDCGALRAGHADQPVNALAGQVETRSSDSFVERNPSGPDVKRAPQFQSAGQVAPAPISAPGESAADAISPPIHEWDGARVTPLQLSNSLAAREAHESAVVLSNSSAPSSRQTSKTGAAPVPQAAPVIPITAGPLSQSGPGGDRGTQSFDDTVAQKWTSLTGFVQTGHAIKTPNRSEPPSDPLTADVLRERLSYDPETGRFTRIKSGIGYRVGDVAGTVTSQGYRKIRLGGRTYLEHRLAWLYMTGEWPADQIDHVNGVKDDNRFTNLREATCAQNQQNRGPQANCASGRKGVYWQEVAKKWHVSVKHHGRRHYVGLFDDLEAATAAYDQKAIELHGEFARPNSIPPIRLIPRFPGVAA